jgi:hypothetical protein
MEHDIERVLKRGSISNTDEFRAVLAYVDELVQESKRQADVERLNALLREFESRKADSIERDQERKGRSP